MGWITHTQNQLQSAADAATLAGAGQLPNGFVAYYLPGQSVSNQQNILTAYTAQASSSAKQFAALNYAGGVSSLTLLDRDIQFGFTDASGNYTPCPTYTGYPNTVKVLMRRDPMANGSLSLFFARVLGINTVDLTATASATIYGGAVDSLNTGTNFRSRILPMTYDINHWNNFLQTGQGPDGTTDFAPNGYPQLNIYPSIKFTGNFGELSLDQSNDGSSTIRDWINNGVSGTDLQNEVSAGLLPLSVHNPLPPPDYTTLAPDWKGNPGLKDSTIKAVGDNINQLYLLPLFKPVDPGVPDPSTYQAGSGQGSNYYYTIVQFVAVQITSVNSQGNNKAISVQPTSLIDPNLVISAPAPAAPPANGSPLITTFIASKLTQ
jgi:hypothetical protein